MDGHNRHRRLNDSLSHHDSHPKYPSQSQVGLPSSAGGGSGSRSERFHLSSTSSPQTPRGVGTSASYSYYQEPATSFSSSTNISAYGSEFGQDGRQQQSQQGFAGYNPNGMLFNVAQPDAQGSVYDTTQQFGARQSAALSMMTPDVTSTYFGGADPSNTSASPSLHQSAHGASSSPANVYQQQRQQQQHAHQPSSALSYSSSMPPGVGVPGQEAAESADRSVHGEPDYSETALEEKWISYQRQLGTVFQNITNGALESASETLLTISDWLLSQVVDLGLTVDDVNLHAGRIKLWNDFNHAWLALGQRQKDIVEAGGHLSQSQSLLSRATIVKMGNTLVRLCDGLERHGLVDYQYGVWEDEIVAILEECLDLFDEDGNEETSR